MSDLGDQPRASTHPVNVEEIHQFVHENRQKTLNAGLLYVSVWSNVQLVTTKFVLCLGNKNIASKLVKITISGPRGSSTVMRVRYTGTPRR